MVDLHVHTTISDGQYTSEQIIEMALMRGIEAIAITNHDTVDGLEEAIYLGKKRGVHIIPGIEISAKGTKNMHILGYFIDHKNKTLVESTMAMTDGRDLRNLELIKKFNEIGLDITMEEVEKLANCRVIGKHHIAHVLLMKGYISKYDDAFSKYFFLPEFASIKPQTTSPKKAIELIVNSGGVAVLAHPRSLKLQSADIDLIIEELISYGLSGLECFYSHNSPEQTRLSIELAKRHGLIMTGGTDFHGHFMAHDNLLGTGRGNNVYVGIEVVEELRKKSGFYNQR